MSADNKSEIASRANELIRALTLQQKHTIFVGKLQAERRVPERVADDYLTDPEWLARIDSTLLPLAERIAKAEQRAASDLRYDTTSSEKLMGAFNQALAAYSVEMERIQNLMRAPGR